MKKLVLILLTFIVCAIQPAKAYEYFKIIFTDGTKSEAFYATDVDSICYSKIGLDGLEYDDWQVQEIYTVDSIYRFSLAQIDNLSFKDVDENQVAKDIVSVSEAITPLYNSCSSPLELSEYLPTIQSIIGVEDAYICNQALYVKIRDWGNLSFYYPIKESISGDGINIPSLSRNRAASSTINNENDEHQQTEALKACVVNQQYRDDNRKWFQKTASIFTACYGYMGIDTITINMPSPEFFQKEMFNYDILFIKTHGGYDKKNNLHWLLTGEELFSRDPKYGLTDTQIGSLKNTLFLRLRHLTYSPRKMSFSWIPERRNGDSIHVLYTKISEEYIRSSKNQFRNAGSAIVFNTACESMMDNPNMEKAFEKRGAGCYLGYDDTNYIGAHAGIHFFARLLVGKSVYSAFETLPDSCKSQVFYIDEKNTIYHDKPSGKKTVKCTPNLKPDSLISNLCIIHPETTSAEELYEDDNLSICLKGGIKIYPFFADLYLLGNTELGFELSTSSDMKQDFHHLGENDGVEYKAETPYLNIELTLDNSNLKPNTTYYYRAYMNDGYSNCYGEIKSFTTKDDNAEAYYVWDDVSKTATYYYDGMRESRGGEEIGSYDMVPYEVERVIFDSSFSKYYPTKFSFEYSRQLQSIENICFLNTDSITNMCDMFRECSSLTCLDMNSFKTSKVTDVCRMFLGCSSLTNLDLSSFFFAKAVDVDCMFNGCSSLKSLKLGSFYIKNSSQWLEGCSSLENITINNLTLSGSAGSKLFYELKSLRILNIYELNTDVATSMQSMFSDCSSLCNLDVSHFNTANVTDMGGMFNECSSLTSLDLSSFDTANVTDMGGMFYNCSSLTSLDLRNFNTSNVISMNGMFAMCESLMDIDLSSFDTANVTDMGGMFFDCISLKSLDLSSFDTANVTDMGGMFNECSSLTSLDLSSFDTANVTDMKSMFNDCSSLTSLDLGNFNTVNVTDMGWMFYDCSSLTSLDLSNFNTGNVTKMSCMFSMCESLTKLDLSRFNIHRAIVDGLFNGCRSLITIYAGNWKSNFLADIIFYGCEKLVGGKGTKIGKNYYDYDEYGYPLYYYCSDKCEAAHIDGGKDNPGLFTAK